MFPRIFSNIAKLFSRWSNTDGLSASITCDSFFKDSFQSFWGPFTTILGGHSLPFSESQRRPYILCPCYLLSLFTLSFWWSTSSSRFQRAYGFQRLLENDRKLKVLEKQEVILWQSQCLKYWSQSVIGPSFLWGPVELSLPLGAVMCTCNLSAQEADVGGLPWVQGQPGPHKWIQGQPALHDKTFFNFYFLLLDIKPRAFTLRATFQAFLIFFILKESHWVAWVGGMYCHTLQCLSISRLLVQSKAKLRAGITWVLFRFSPRDTEPAPQHRTVSYIALARNQSS